MIALARSVDAAGKLTERVINHYLTNYYNEWFPSFYDRMEYFLYSCVRSEVEIKNNKCYCTIFIDYKNIHYKHIGLYKGVWQIVQWANEGIHGNIDVGGEHFFDKSIEESERFIIINFSKWLEKATGCKAQKR